MMDASICPEEDVYGLKRGKKILLFQKGVKIWVRVERDDKTWQAFRRLLLDENQYQCQLCKRQKSNAVDNIILQIHHFTHVAKNPELTYNKKNCIVLCIDCHKKQHPNTSFGQRLDID